MIIRAFFAYCGEDVTNDVRLENGKKLPGWSQYELWHGDKLFGWVENGFVCSLKEGYSYSEVPDGDTL